MKKLTKTLKVLGLTLCGTACFNASAYHYGMAGCGLGSLVFEDKPGKIQILAATTNDILTPQTSAITSGTSNCYEEQAKVANVYMENNHNSLLMDISRGNGETLSGLSKIFECQDEARFNETLKNKVDLLDATKDNLGARIKATISNDSTLATSCKIVG